MLLSWRYRNPHYQRYRLQKEKKDELDKDIEFIPENLDVISIKCWRSLGKFHSIQPRTCIFLWNVEEEKTLLTPRHSLNAFSEPRPCRPLELVQASKSWVPMLRAFLDVKECSNSSVRPPMLNLKNFPDKPCNVIAILVGRTCSVTEQGGH